VSAHLVVVETKSCKNEYANWTNCCFVSKLTWCRVCASVAKSCFARSNTFPRCRSSRIRSDFTLESRVWLITIAGSAPNRCLIKRTRPSRGEQIIHSILPGRKRNENIYFHRCANPFAGGKLKESWNAPLRHTHTQPARHQRPRRAQYRSRLPVIHHSRAQQPREHTQSTQTGHWDNKARAQPHRGGNPPRKLHQHSGR
jgi:hypothetical protein